MKNYLLFDLDGTLTDPKEGITKCVQYALHSFGIEEPDLDKLEPFIGPPLKESFMEFYQMSEEQAAQAVEKYRERFHDTGIFENKLYDGIPEMLRTLQSKGLHLAVASSKPTVYVERILEHFHIDKYFQVVVGSELDGRRVNKDEVVQEALKRLFGDEPVAKEKVYMIGDRKFDVQGAKALHIDSVGVTFGYGGMDELREAKADYIVRTVDELQKFLLRGTDEQEKKPTFFQRIWVMLYAFLLFMFVRNVVLYGLNLLLLQVGTSMSGPLIDMLVLRDETGTLIGYPGNVSTIMSALAFIGGALVIKSTALPLITKTAEDMKLTHLKGESRENYILLGVTVAGAVVGLNLLFELLGITTKSAAYQAVAADQYSANIVIGLICYGVVTPIAEEFLFRGVIYNYLKRFMNMRIAILLSAFVFGAYHMNMVQGVYAFIMGCLIAYAYDYFGSYKVPVAIHIASNVIAYFLSFTALAVTSFVSWPVCVICLGAAIICMTRLSKQKNIF